MKARSVFAAIALTAGLAFTQAPAQASSTTNDPMVQLVRPVSKPVRACIIGKKLAVGKACHKPTPKAKPGYFTFR